MAYIPGSIPVTGFIGPTDDSDVYAVTDAIYGIDGYRSLSSTTVRNAITTERRREGMLVYTQNDQNVWQLLPEPWVGTDVDWKLFISSAASTSLTAVTTASNGLTKTDNNITLGGLLTGSTYIDNSGFLFRTNEFSAQTISTSNLSGDTQIDVWRNLIIQDGIVIEAANGGSQIDLRPSSINGAWQITSDSGTYGDGSAWIYSQQSNGVQIALGNGGGLASFIDRAMGIGIYPQGYAALNGNAFNITIQMNATLEASSANLDNPSIFIGSKNSTISSGITNSVIIGGQNITGTTSDTVFMPKINLASTSEAQILIPSVNASAPSDGSMWFTTSGGTTYLNYRVSGTTKSVELT